jgi:hypothetical protein
MPVKKILTAEAQRRGGNAEESKTGNVEAGLRWGKSSLVKSAVVAP